MNRDAADFVEDLMRLFGEYAVLMREADSTMHELRELRWWGCLVFIWRTEWDQLMDKFRHTRRQARKKLEGMEEIVGEMESRAGQLARHMFKAMLKYEAAIRQTIQAQRRHV